MSNQVEISPTPVELSDVQNPVALHQTNPVSNTSVEFITILSNGIDQDPVTEMTEQLHVHLKLWTNLQMKNIHCSILIS